MHYFRMPTDEHLRQSWIHALDGIECGNSNYLCINHFNTTDMKMKGGRFVLNKDAVPVFERENSRRDDDERNVSDDINDANQMDSQEMSTSGPSSQMMQSTVDSLDTGVHSTHDPNSCDNCDTLRDNIQRLEKQISDMKALHSVEVMKMEEKLSAQKESSKKHVKEKKSLKNTLIYHKNKQLKLQEVIQSLHADNLISNEAAADLNVILKSLK